ncbi:MAG: helix-turn-helix transcriptional regulator [Pseudomonadota bacterium]
MADQNKRKHTQDAELEPMSADAFRDWRKRLGLKQKDAAELLGLKKRMIQYYETGKRSGKDVAIPKSIRLACYALENGIGDFDGESVLLMSSASTVTLQALQNLSRTRIDAEQFSGQADHRLGKSDGDDQDQVSPHQAAE